MRILTSDFLKSEKTNSIKYEQHFVDFLKALTKELNCDFFNP